MIRALLALALVAGCDGATTVRGCDDDLAGVWRSEGGTWQLLDHRARLELYPLHRELPTALPERVVAAPLVIDLTRTRGAAPTGTATRRYERGAQFCRRTAPATLRTCADDRLTIDLAPPPPPDDWTACTGAAGAPTVLALTRVR